jgi:signal peptidase II
VIVLCDQVTKLVARLFLKNNHLRANAFLSFEYSENTGAAWSIFKGHASVLALLGLATMATLVLFRRSFIAAGQKFSVAMVFGGILGNTIDRIFHGYVTDFVSLDLKFYRWPTFNIADVAILFGVAILLFTFQRKSQEAR